MKAIVNIYKHKKVVVKLNLLPFYKGKMYAIFPLSHLRKSKKKKKLKK